jgi:hypothetical protein
MFLELFPDYHDNMIIFYLATSYGSLDCHDNMAILVPHSESGVVPMSSLSGVGLLGFWEFGMGGLIG